MGRGRRGAIFLAKIKLEQGAVWARAAAAAGGQAGGGWAAEGLHFLAETSVTEKESILFAMSIGIAARPASGRGEEGAAPRRRDEMWETESAGERMGARASGTIQIGVRVRRHSF